MGKKGLIVMTKLTFTTPLQGNTTLLENEFIDEYMPAANGEFVKVYILLLRFLSDPTKETTIASLADHLECPENDVKRALDYWEKKGLFSYDSEAGDLRGETAASDQAPSAAPVAELPAKPEKAVRKMKRHTKNRKEFKEITHVTEMFLGKTLNKTESEALVYFYDELGMSAELIEYLVETCADNGHKSIHYINAVALSWTDNHITTVEEAKAASGQYNRNSYAVLNAFGIKGRAPAASEIKFIRRWNEEYGFTCDLILEACDRTMQAIHQPSFEYADKILNNWKDRGVHTMEDVEALDIEHHKEKATKKSSPAKEVNSNRVARPGFNNFKGREYSDMDDLTRRLIEAQ